jgi:esterase/lipase superfamily enzyme
MRAPSLCRRALVALALTLPIAGAPAWAAAAAAPAETARASEHRQATLHFNEMLDKDPKAALAYAQEQVRRAGALGRNDPRRADALEMLARSELGAEKYREALPRAAEVVRIRRLADPADHELLALALGLNATLLFAVDRFEEADAMLGESLASWRSAYGKDDVRLAQKLEAQAEYVQKGYGRTAWVIELLREAVQIRTADAASSRGKLAETLEELAIHEMRQGVYGNADEDLATATRLLEGESRRQPENEEMRAGLAQMLVMRAGLAAKLGNQGRALELARTAGAMKFKNRVLRAENAGLVAASLSITHEMAGDLDAAIAEQWKILELAETYRDLYASGALDAGVIADADLQLGELYLQQDVLPLARQAIDLAHQQLGDTAEVLLARSELERRSGDAAQALKLYQAALRTRKESASEVTVLFGTSRAPLPGGVPGRFGAEAAREVSVGQAAVLVPGGQFGTQVWMRPAAEPPVPVGRATNAEHLLIRSKRVLKADQFRARARGQMAGARLYPKAALVFVHGFNVSFDQALQRGAQLARDMNFDGPVFVFSWPSQGSMLKYGTDRTSADAAVDRLVEFLGQVEDATGAEQIHVIAHSMGNRVLLPSLARIAVDPSDALRRRLGEIVLAAPAVPEADFGKWLDTIVGHGIDRITLYASAVDRAMWAGWAREWGTTLAGYAAGGVPLLHAHVQSIDITKAASPSLMELNHDVFASNPVMTEDMRQVLQAGSRRPPDSRLPTLRPQPLGGNPRAYWSYVPLAARP